MGRDYKVGDFFRDPNIVPPASHFECIDKPPEKEPEPEVVVEEEEKPTSPKPETYADYTDEPPVIPPAPEKPKRGWPKGKPRKPKAAQADK